MSKISTRLGIRGLLVLTLVALALPGCGGGQETAEAFAGTKTEVATTIKGEVRTGREILKQGKLTVEDFKGQAVTSAEWNDSPKFTVDVPAGTLYPIVLTAHGQDSSGAHQMLKLVVTSPTTFDQLITPSTTAIAQKAQEMGGYTPDNVTAAAMEDVKPRERGSHH
jgi:hypothetical protein